MRVYDTPGGRVQAVRGADLLVRAGRSVAIVGPSGSGKSSLLRMIAGLDEPTAGEVLINGIVVGSSSRRRRRQMRASAVRHVYQRPSDNLLAHLTMRQQLNRTARSHAQSAADVDEILTRLGLRHREHHLPTQLSGGEQQRFAFARSAVSRPSIIIADEPTAELDSENTGRVLDAIDALTDNGISVLLATHDPQVLDHIDEVVLLRDGAIASVTDRRGELAVIDEAGRLPLPAAARLAFSQRRVRTAWDPVTETLTVTRPNDETP
ncbi:MAG: ABC transporter ATP-binding protein [Ilumatobacter sp.]